MTPSASPSLLVRIIYVSMLAKKFYLIKSKQILVLKEHNCIHAKTKMTCKERS